MATMEQCVKNTLIGAMKTSFTHARDWMDATPTDEDAKFTPVINLNAASTSRRMYAMEISRSRGDIMRDLFLIAKGVVNIITFSGKSFGELVGKHNQNLLVVMNETTSLAQKRSFVTTFVNALCVRFKTRPPVVVVEYVDAEKLVPVFTLFLESFHSLYYVVRGFQQHIASQAWGPNDPTPVYLIAVAATPHIPVEKLPNIHAKDFRTLEAAYKPVYDAVTQKCHADGGFFGFHIMAPI